MGQPTRTIKAVTQQGSRPPVPKNSKTVIAVQHREESPIGREAFLATVEKLGYEPIFPVSADPQLKEAYRKNKVALEALHELARE